jgi:hypothetical protein
MVRSAPRATREVAAVRLARDPVLLEIAASHPDAQARGDVLFAIADKKALASFAEQDPSADVRRWAAAAAAADPARDLVVEKAGCQRAAWRANDVLCDATVLNRGASAYDDLFFRLRGAAGGEMAGGSRLEPGERKKFTVMGSAGMDGGAVSVELTRAQAFRPR